MHDASAIAVGVAKRKSRAVVILLGAATAFLTLGVLYLPIFGPQMRDLGDLHDHLLVVQHMGSEWAGNIYSLFFLATYALSLGSKDIYTISCVGTVLLTVSVVAKAFVSYVVIEKAARNAILAGLTSLALCLVMPLPNWWKPSQIYLDKIAPNVWFNATAIVTMPFAIALFFSALKWLEAPTVRRLAWVAVFSVLSVLTKPNYILAFFPLLGLIVLTRALVDRRSATVRALLWFCGLGILLGAILLVQYYACVTSGPWAGPGVGQESGHISFSPFAVWSLYSPNIPASMLLSIAFPLVVLFVYFKESKHDTAVVLAWVGLAMAVLQYALLAETGETFPDQNWIWGSNVAMYLLFLVSARLVVSQRRSWKFYLVAPVFGLHLGAGIYYYLKLAFGIDYF
jgi:hypothetical protein